MPLDTKVGIGPSDFVLDGDPALPKSGTVPPIFGPCLLLPNGCMDQDAPLGMEMGLGPGDIVLDGDPALPKSGTALPPNFRSMSIVTKRSPISATAAELLCLNDNFSSKQTKI